MSLRYLKIRSDYLATLVENAREDLALSGNLTDTYRARLQMAVAGGKAAFQTGPKRQSIRQIAKKLVAKNPGLVRRLAD